MKDNFYKQLTENEQQECDLCRDWNLGDCERCEFVSRCSLKDKQTGGKTMNVVLYTINCQKCLILEKKLEAKNIEFLRVSDRETLVAKGFSDKPFPILEVDGVEMSYKTAIEWVNNQ